MNEIKYIFNSYYIMIKNKFKYFVYNKNLKEK